MNALPLIRDHALRRGSAPAIIDTVNGRDRVLSFAELDLRADKLASLLVRSGLRAGDRVVMLIPLGLELYVTLLALLRLGLVAVFFDPAFGREAAGRRIAELAPAGLVSSRSACLAAAATCGAIRRIPVKITLGRGLPGTLDWHVARGFPRATDYPRLSEASPAIITLTSGSTGTPKLIERTHGFLASQYEVIGSNFGILPGSTQLVTLPMFVLANLAAGATSVLPDADPRRPLRVNARRIAAQIARRRISRILAPPALLGKLLDDFTNHPRALSCVGQVFTGGGPVFPDLLDRFETVLPRGSLHIIYGATEAEPICTVTAAQITTADREAMRRGGGILAGRPVAQIHCRILADAQSADPGADAKYRKQRATMCARVRGEIIVAGKHVIPCCLKADGDAKCKVVVDGVCWHRTGDAGYFDDEGRLWLLGRSAASDGCVYPYEIEVPARETQGVVATGFLSLEGRNILAVEPQPGLSRPQRSLLADRLRKPPVDEVRIIKRVPMDTRHHSKVDYSSLASILEAA